MMEPCSAGLEFDFAAGRQIFLPQLERADYDGGVGDRVVRLITDRKLDRLGGERATRDQQREQSDGKRAGWLVHELLLW
jgi:hypothetical protein